MIKELITNITKYSVGLESKPGATLFIRNITIFVIIILNYSLKSEQSINKSIIFALHIKEFQL